MSRGLRAGLAVALVSIAVPASASAAKTVGSNLVHAADGAVCPAVLGPPFHDCTDSIAGLAPADAALGGATVPTDGIVVKWRIKRGAADTFTVGASLRVIRGTTGVGRSAAVTLPPAAGTYEFPTRLPVKAGDQIGVDLTGIPIVSVNGVAVAHKPADAADLLDEWTTLLPEGSAVTPAPDNQPATELLLNADVEADADGDGFGDETQDLCPTNAATQLSCAAGAPDTTITKAPKKKSTKTKATVEFTSNVTGATFQCSLDSVAYTACSSPLQLKSLHKGTHILLVRALAAGIPDPSPASARFTVKKKKKRH